MSWVWFGHRDSYEVWRTADGGLSVHQLVVIANGADPYKVFSGGQYAVHHKNNIPWDNRPDNLELLSSSEHAKLHAINRDYSDFYDNTNKPWWDEDILRELYYDEGLTQAEIADKFDVSASTISDRFKDFDIEGRQCGRQKIEIPLERLKEYIGDSSITQRDLADEFDTTPHTIRKRLDEAGL